jgi:hypothetical protein
MANDSGLEEPCLQCFGKFEYKLLCTSWWLEGVTRVICLLWSVPSWMREIDPGFRCFFTVKNNISPFDLPHCFCVLLESSDLASFQGKKHWEQAKSKKITQNFWIKNLYECGIEGFDLGGWGMGLEVYTVRNLTEFSLVLYLNNSCNKVFSCQWCTESQNFS